VVELVGGGSGRPPTSPIRSEKARPQPRRVGVTWKAKARREKVCQFMVPVVRPLMGNTATHPTRPPRKAIRSPSKLKFLSKI